MLVIISVNMCKFAFFFNPALQRVSLNTARTPPRPSLDAAAKTKSLLTFDDLDQFLGLLRGFFVAVVCELLNLITVILRTHGSPSWSPLPRSSKSPDIGPNKEAL